MFKKVLGHSSPQNQKHIFFLVPVVLFRVFWCELLSFGNISRKERLPSLEYDGTTILDGA